ncbi:hypothetical protein [Dactylosporangium sp. NPDC050588]|uniref:hypothetical protein n=1 Tax=Dactylosporangium sp. NPDC050588 TaxID=3157211 RepID=UPI0033CCF6A8
MTIDHGVLRFERVFAMADSVVVAGYVARRHRECVSVAVRALLPGRRPQRDPGGPARETLFARHGAGRGGHLGGRRQAWSSRRRGSGRSPLCVDGAGARGR